MQRSVLVVDDDDVIHVILERELERRGLAAEHHTDPIAAIDDLLSRTPRELPCLILLDIRMPVLDGHQFLARIRASEHLGSLPVLALSGSVLDADRDRAWAAGLVGYFRKPDDLDGFRALADFIRNYEMLNQPPSGLVSA